MMMPIEAAILSELKMVAVILVLDIRNGILVYHMLDRAIYLTATYLTAIGFFANCQQIVKENNNVDNRKREWWGITEIDNKIRNLENE